jgi:hypothetical protein
MYTVIDTVCRGFSVCQTMMLTLRKILMAVFYVHVTVHRNKFLFNKTIRRTNFPNLFCQENLHVSGSSSAHHQEFSTVHSALAYVIKSA